MGMESNMLLYRTVKMDPKLKYKHFDRFSILTIPKLKLVSQANTNFL